MDTIPFTFGRNQRPALLAVEDGWLVAYNDFAGEVGEELCRFRPGLASRHKVQQAAQTTFEQHRTKAGVLASHMLQPADLERALRFYKDYLRMLKRGPEPTELREHIIAWLSQPGQQSHFRLTEVSVAQKRELLRYLEADFRTRWAKDAAATRRKNKERQRQGTLPL